MRLLVVALCWTLTTAITLVPRSDRTIRERNLIIAEQIHAYSVTGTSVRTIGDSLRGQGILLEGGKHFRGAYVWRLNWRFWFKADGFGCRMTDAQVHLASITAVPTWSDDGASDYIKTQWERYEKALLAHEEKHRDIAVASARTLRPQLMRLRNRNCDSLKAAGNELGNKVSAQIQTLQDEYDTATRHGHTEGARWPPG